MKVLFANHLLEQSLLLVFLVITIFQKTILRLVALSKII